MQDDPAIKSSKSRFRTLRDHCKDEVDQLDISDGWEYSERCLTNSGSAVFEYSRHRCKVVCSYVYLSDRSFERILKTLLEEIRAHEFRIDETIILIKDEYVDGIRIVNSSQKIFRPDSESEFESYEYVMPTDQPEPRFKFPSRISYIEALAYEYYYIADDGDPSNGCVNWEDDQRDSFLEELESERKVGLIDLYCKLAESGDHQWIIDRFYDLDPLEDSDHDENEIGWRYQAWYFVQFLHRLMQGGLLKGVERQGASIRLEPELDDEFESVT